MISLFQSHAGEFLTGFGWTILSSVLALIGSTILGTAFAIMEVVPNKLANIIGRIYIEIVRNIPLLVITMFFYVVIANVIKISGFAAGTFGLTLYTSAFIAETVRAGINAVPKGQLEGAMSNGLSWWQGMRYVVLPQAFKLVIPPLGNQFINLIKNSSVLAFVAGLDLMYQANQISQSTFDTFGPFIIVGIFYLILTMPLSYYMRYLENRLEKKGGQA
ncbi:amino acid ABC transporter permease [Weissella sagaensis]|jgi:putative glutamine transport system permease protein|uniref:Amino acid ABC transporter permease n=1 Tax=Weissella sagaensis TaxID=2559928 RepID=A0ABW1RSI5_9LACO|nr:amino acid ABC transporter permease [Weissella sagaensis]KAA8434019.1 amino acid ABC transporter permease [Weissella paramesenteroides]QDJ58256.1 amino acid ABC transporter permease [Weissella hellenica]KAA8438211.1 amino acid ABC transporter permease [Weissella paramesenteroides]QEA57249.1 amino acid ABC transporter permease [Weissella hellenica]UEG66363.1 amino acid ABC transporter permease [Weissella hellenica]